MVKDCAGKIKKLHEEIEDVYNNNIWPFVRNDEAFASDTHQLRISGMSMEELQIMSDEITVDAQIEMGAGFKQGLEDTLSAIWETLLNLASVTYALNPYAWIRPDDFTSVWARERREAWAQELAGLAELLADDPLAIINAIIEDIADKRAEYGDGYLMGYGLFQAMELVVGTKGGSAALKGLKGAKLAGKVDDVVDVGKAIMPKPPKSGSLSNVDARRWYLDAEQKIPEILDRTKPLEQQARQAHSLRNQFRTQTRDAMSNKLEADNLNIYFPNKTWEQLVMEYESRGFSGDALYEEIINASQRSNPMVNQELGIFPN
jgi:filamentous hemagglutinin